MDWAEEEAMFHFTTAECYEKLKAFQREEEELDREDLEDWKEEFLWRELREQEEDTAAPPDEPAEEPPAEEEPEVEPTGSEEISAKPADKQRNVYLHEVLKLHQKLHFKKLQMKNKFVQSMHFKEM